MLTHFCVINVVGGRCQWTTSHLNSQPCFLAEHRRITQHTPHALTHPSAKSVRCVSDLIASSAI